MIELLSFCTATFRKSLVKVTQPLRRHRGLLYRRLRAERPARCLCWSRRTGQVRRRPPRDTSTLRLYASWRGTSPAQWRDSSMELRPEGRATRIHRTGCRHCSRWQDCCALRLSQSQICIAGAPLLVVEGSPVARLVVRPPKIPAEAVHDPCYPCPSLVWTPSKLGPHECASPPLRRGHGSQSPRSSLSWHYNAKSMTSVR
jgi:hypothetical protein